MGQLKEKVALTPAEANDKNIYWIDKWISGAEGALGTYESKRVTEEVFKEMLTAGTLVLGENATEAYRGDRGKIAYDHSQIPHAPDDAQKNVQSDWNQTDLTQDDFILNKPTLAQTITADIPVVLQSGFTLGKYKNGDIIPSQGWTFEQYAIDIAQDYVPPTLGGINVTPQSTTIEVGETISGSKTFSWSLSQNSGQVATVDIMDITAGNNLATGISSTSPSTQTVVTNQLNSDGANQQWRIKGINGNGSDIFSNIRTVTARYMRYWGATPTLPSGTDGAVNRTYGENLPSNSFQASTTFTLQTGTIEDTFVVLLPPTKVITNVTDTTNLNANLTSNYVLSTITVKDIGGTDRTYNMYTLSLAGPYSTSANHVITTNN